ncbi:iron complex transport system substrate-binding protein [Devosia sp. YR412]|uniref:ABC transporter substrate-binding protein n=1 Tax=Devosia sp. YR412 TaxID=1881030 RepID=UPI0008AAD559|nr:ABC transporter substrate-binding protein [Devosia sp. YR412]SEQ61640.1 iron complex transport system substrate-binding protein [Devosia sp. YR412]
MRLLALAAILAGLTLSARAQDTHTITDHAGFAVEIPVEPLRVVSLHDWTATVMTYELGGNLVGSTGRLNKTTGEYFIRSGRELYQLGFGHGVEMASVHGQLDMEMIAALEPDLIIGNTGDTLEFRDQLNLIAPTMMFDPQNGHAPLDNYRDLAGWVNRTEKFDELLAQYEARIAAAKPIIMAENAAPTYVAMTPNPEDGDIRIFSTYGAQTQVLEDLGFLHGAIADRVPDGEQEAYFSAEIIGELNTDYIFSSHIVDDGEDETTMLKQLEEVAPGASQTLPSVQNNKFISMQRFFVYPTTFAAMNYVLDELEALAK